MTTFSGTCAATPVLGSLGFENGITPTSGANSWYTGSLASYSHVVSDPTANGGASLETDWTQTSGGDAGTAVYGAMAQSATRVYAHWRYKQQPNFDNSGAHKFLRFRQAGFNALLGTLDIADNHFTLFYDVLNSVQSFFINVGSETGYTPNDLRGSWHTYEALNDITTSGQLHFQFWIDGVLKMDHYVNASNQGYSIGLVSFNGTFNGPATTGTDWMDDLVVSTNCTR